MQRRIVTTAALIYANGDVHIGHLVEYIQADIWTRFQKMRGHDCIYICADDTHGTPIMVAAREKGCTPEELIAEQQKRHIADFKDFEIDFDHFSTTHSAENKALAEEFFQSLQDAGHISSRKIMQLYDEKEKMFLPDRFVKGTCPNCKAEDQYGDSCDVCGATYSPKELINPVSAVSGTQPIEKESEHLFFRLENFRDFLKDWVPQHTAPEISKKLMEWFSDELRDWDISRDEPYFGFEIPGHPGKYFYVWLDAPIGYISSTQQWCEQNGRKLSEFWEDEKAERYHFIGKDIINFHCLFWPSMVRESRFQLPNGVFVHGMLTVNGQKMSKSKGTSIKARTYLKYADPGFLRYYYACKLGSGSEDLDLSFDDFVQRVNSDLIGKITNLASRGAQMLNKNFQGQLASELDEQGAGILKDLRSAGTEVATLFENRDFSKAINLIRSHADIANKYFDEHEPWKLVKEDKEKTQKILSSVLNVFRLLAIYLTPVLPSYSQKVSGLFKESSFTWADLEVTRLRGSDDRDIEEYEHLAKRIEIRAVNKMAEESKPKEAAPKKKKAPKSSAPPEEIDFDQFSKVDLRIAKIVEAENVEGADKLLRLQLDIGEVGKKQVFAGLKAAYLAEDLVGRLTVVVANLKPRKMKFGMSEAMILAAGPGGKDLFILDPDEGAVPGQRVK